MYTPGTEFMHTNVVSNGNHNVEVTQSIRTILIRNTKFLYLFLMVSEIFLLSLLGQKSFPFLRPHLSSMLTEAMFFF